MDDEPNRSPLGKILIVVLVLLSLVGIAGCTGVALVVIALDQLGRSLETRFEAVADEVERSK